MLTQPCVPTTFREVLSEEHGIDGSGQYVGDNDLQLERVSPPLTRSLAFLFANSRLTRRDFPFFSPSAAQCLLQRGEFRVTYRALCK